MNKPLMIAGLLIASVIFFKDELAQKLNEYDVGAVAQAAVAEAPARKVAAQKTVVMYSTPTCGYCKKARRFFETNAIPYSDRNVDASLAAAKEMQALGGRGVPTIKIDDHVIFGWDESAVRNSLL